MAKFIYGVTAIVSLFQLAVQGAPLRTCSDQDPCIEFQVTPSSDHNYEVCLWWDKSNTNCNKGDKISHACPSTSESSKIEGFAELTQMCKTVACGSSASFGLKDSTGCSASASLTKTLNNITASCSGENYCGGGSGGSCQWSIPVPACTPSPTPFPTTPQPTFSPTPQPTNSPISPTFQPTPQPSLEPTLKPTNSPTMEPTPQPSPQPTGPSFLTCDSEFEGNLVEGETQTLEFTIPANADSVTFSTCANSGAGTVLQALDVNDVVVVANDAECIDFPTGDMIVVNGEPGTVTTLKVTTTSPGEYSLKVDCVFANGDGTQGAGANVQNSHQNGLDAGELFTVGSTNGIISIVGVAVVVLVVLVLGGWCLIKWHYKRKFKKHMKKIEADGDEEEQSINVDDATMR